jgi:hypothetical protein
MKRKEAVYKGLEFIDVYFEDTSLTSPEYFQITEFPTRLTAGKNLFKLRGHPTNLRVGGVLNLEVLDYNGDPIYHEVIDYIDEDKSRVIAIYVYEETSPGDCTVTLICEAQTINNAPVPQEWQGRPNVKWKRSIPVNPNVSNDSEIIFSKLPEITVSEQVGVQLDRIYSGSQQFPTYITGQVRYFSLNGTPAIEISGGKFTGDMKTGTITVTTPVNPTPTPNFEVVSAPYVSTIKKILSDTTALLDTQYIVYSSQSLSPQIYTAFDYSAFSLSYEASPTYIPTENSQSFALVQIKGLEPATGDVSRIKVYTNNKGTVGTWEQVNDVELEETEIFVTSTASLFPDESIGIFTSQSIIDTYWEGFTYLGKITSTAPTLTWSTASLNNAMNIASAVSITAANAVNVVQQKTAYAGIFIATSSYKVTIDALGTRGADGLNPRLSVYVSGSAVAFDSTDYFNQEFPRRLGKKIGELEVTSDSQRFDDTVFNFESDADGTANLLFVVESGQWQIADVRTTTDNDAGYSPNYTRIRSLINTPHKANNQISFKVEYYNVAGVKCKQISYLYDKNWAGGNRYIDGDYSMLTGSLYVADSLESGVAISGYKNSGFVRSLGYEGFDSGFAGFLLWSGSALNGQLTKGAVTYSGVGLELYLNTSSYFRYSTTDDEIYVATQNFFFGDPNGTYISGSNGLLEISSSGFHLNSNGDVTASNADFQGVATANIILDKTITINTSNSSSYLQSFTLSTGQTAYRIRLDGTLGGEQVRKVQFDCQLLYAVGGITVPSAGSTKRLDVTLIAGSSNFFKIYDIFSPGRAGLIPAQYDIITINRYNSVTLSVFSTSEAFTTSGTVTPFEYNFLRNINVGDGDSAGGLIDISRSGSLSGTNIYGPRIRMINEIYGQNNVFSITQGGSSISGFLNSNEPYWGIFLRLNPDGSEPYIAFSGSADSNNRRTMISSGVHHQYREISGILNTVGTSDYFITATNTSGTCNITLPTGSYVEQGRVLSFKYRQTGGTVVINADGTDTIDGAATRTTTTQYSAVTMVCNGIGQWNIISEYGTWT